VAANKLKFTPAANARGAGYASFTFQVQDDGGTANGGVDLDPTPRTITVDVTSVNDAPAGASKTVTTLEDTDYTFAALDFGFTDANDSPANALLAVKVTTLPAAGTLKLNGVAVTAGQFVSATDVAANKLKFTPALNARVRATRASRSRCRMTVERRTAGWNLDPTSRTITVDVTSAERRAVGRVEDGYDLGGHGLHVRGLGLRVHGRE
jgi:hypothetical protein